MDEELPVDVFRRIVSFSTNSRSLLDLYQLNPSAQEATSKEIRKLSKKSIIHVDLAKFFRENNPFEWEFYENGDKEHRKRLHEKIRELTRLLESLSEISGRFQIDNLTASALGFQAEIDELYMDRAPFMLQKKLVHILTKFESPEICISPVFMRPSRMIRTFRHRFETITSLDLGNMKALSAMKLRSTVFPALTSLKKLTWHHANIHFLQKIPQKSQLTHLNLTCHLVGEASWRDFEVFEEFKNLESFYFGFTVPCKPSRMVMDVLLNVYQAIWIKKIGKNKEFLIKNFPKIKEIGFWNSPEKIFQQISKNSLHLETLNFGQISQSLNKLCSFDSILQSFFKFEEAESLLEQPKIRNLNMNLHAMPVVGLDYYLPNLMNHVNKIPTLKSVSLFFKCLFHSQMTSSWSLESKKEKSSRRRPVLDAQYTHFKLHSEGLCGLEDLDRQLPPSLESCTISLNLPSESANKVIQSVLTFIEKLGSINDFPELVDFHINVSGVKCFELLTHTIGTHLGPHLRQISIFAPPANTDKPYAKRLLQEMPDLFPKATRISLTPEFLKIVMKEHWMTGPQWSEKIRKLARKSKFNVEQCHLTSETWSFEGFVPKPEDPGDLRDPGEILESFEDVKKEETEYLDDFEEEYEDEEDPEHLEDLEDTTIVYESEEDELEELERKLEKESDKRHKKWEKKKRIVLSDDDESDKENQEEVEEEDLVDWDKLDEDEGEEQRERNAFLDDEAIESDGEGSVGDEEEEEDEEIIEIEEEDLADSDDERLFANGPNRKRKADQAEKNAKRRKIVVSDDEDD